MVRTDVRTDLQAAIGRLAADRQATKARSGKKGGKKAQEGGQARDRPHDEGGPGDAAWSARQAEKNLRKARTRDSLQALSKLGEVRRRRSTGSSANRRSWSRCGTSQRSTA